MDWLEALEKLLLIVCREPFHIVWARLPDLVIARLLHNGHAFSLKPWNVVVWNVFQRLDLLRLGNWQLGARVWLSLFRVGLARAGTPVSFRDVSLGTLISHLDPSSLSQRLYLWQLDYSCTLTKTNFLIVNLDIFNLILNILIQHLHIIVAAVANLTILVNGLNLRWIWALQLLIGSLTAKIIWHFVNFGIGHHLLWDWHLLLV